MLEKNIYMVTLLAKVFGHSHPPLFEQMKMHENIYFLQRHDICLDEHPNEEYPQVHQVSQKLLSQLEMIWSDRLPTLGVVKVPDSKEKTGTRKSYKFW